MRVEAFWLLRRVSRCSEHARTKEQRKPELLSLYLDIGFEDLFYMSGFVSLLGAIFKSLDLSILYMLLIKGNFSIAW